MILSRFLLVSQQLMQDISRICRELSGEEWALVAEGACKACRLVATGLNGGCGCIHKQVCRCPANYRSWLQQAVYANMRIQPDPTCLDVVNHCVHMAGQFGTCNIACDGRQAMCPSVLKHCCHS